MSSILSHSFSHSLSHSLHTHSWSGSRQILFYLEYDKSRKSNIYYRCCLILCYSAEWQQHWPVIRRVISAWSWAPKLVIVRTKSWTAKGAAAANWVHGGANGVKWWRRRGGDEVDSWCSSPSAAAAFFHHFPLKNLNTNMWRDFTPIILWIMMKSDRW